MGDVVLTSPIVRCIKKKYPGCELHFVVKEKFKEAVLHNSYIDRLHTFNAHPRELLETLKAEKFDFVADLQRNRKSTWLRKKLNTTGAAFPKLNVRKFLLVWFNINRMPTVHVVDRYFKAVEKIGVSNDQQGLDFFVPPAQDVFDSNTLAFLQNPFITLVLGATYYTKRIPQAKLEEIIEHLQLPVVLLGGPAEKELADTLQKKYPQVKNTVGQTSLVQTAVYIQHAQSVITSDTGLMHIAAAFGKKIVSVWGNTVPDFGMAPYMPQSPERSFIVEVKGLSCRPCSKLGYDHCPKKHFRCMLDHNGRQIASTAEERP